MKIVENLVYERALLALITEEVRKTYVYLRQLHSGYSEAEVINKYVEACCMDELDLSVLRLCAGSMLSLVRELGIANANS